jgi:transposase
MPKTSFRKNSGALVILGVDTHLDLHVAVLINTLGQVICTAEFATNSTGYAKLLRWCQSFGHLTKAGFEGTGTYGAGFCLFLSNHQITVYEVNRPNRARRRLRGKSDPTDAENAARAVLADEASHTKNIKRVSRSYEILVDCQT